MMRGGSMDSSALLQTPGEVCQQERANYSRRSMSAAVGTSSDGLIEALARARLRQSSDQRRISMEMDGGAETDAGDDDASPRKKNLYKTELCRSFTEQGVCKYSGKCQVRGGKKNHAHRGDIA